MSRTTNTTAWSRSVRRSMRLRPAPHCRTRVPELLAEGHARRIISSIGSRTRTAIGLRVWCFPRRRTSFAIQVDLMAEHAVINPFDFFVEPSAEDFPFVYSEDAATELRCLISIPVPPGPRLEAIASLRLPARAEQNDRLPCRAQCALHQAIRYVIRMEPGVQTPEETLSLRLAAPAATAPGCWCSCCAAWASRRVSSPAI